MKLRKWLNSLFNNKKSKDIIPSILSEEVKSTTEGVAMEDEVVTLNCTPHPLVIEAKNRCHENRKQELRDNNIPFTELEGLYGTKILSVDLTPETQGFKFKCEAYNQKLIDNAYKIAKETLVK